MKVVIVGGSDAGISAALEIRSIDPLVDVCVILRDEFPNFSICGLPMALSGEVADWRNLAHRTRDVFEKEGITLLTSHDAVGIDATNKTIKVKRAEGSTFELPYDKLIIGTGANSRIPESIKGLSNPGVFTLRWMGDLFAIEEHLQRELKTATIVGGGYIGLELADGLTKRGLKTTLLERGEQVLRTCHRSFGRRVMDNLQNHTVDVVTKMQINEIVANKDHGLTLHGTDGYKATTDIVIICVGAVPNTVLGESIGATLASNGAFVVNTKMETNVPNVYAAGDCAMTHHRLLKDPVYLALGTTSHKQGRVAGMNAIGVPRTFKGSIGTQVIKIFDDAVGRTGLSEDEAVEAGYYPFTIEFETYDHKVYYPGAHKIIIRLTCDRTAEKILGAQMYGHYSGQIAKRIDIFSQAIYHGMTAEDLNDLDLAYTPPLSSPWDPTQMAAQEWLKQYRDQT